MPPPTADFTGNHSTPGGQNSEIQPKFQPNGLLLSSLLAEMLTKVNTRPPPPTLIVLDPHPLQFFSK